MKRLIPVLLLLILAVSLAFGAQAADTADRFTDWDSIDHQPEVAMLSDLQVISGYTDGSFRPYNSVTRAEIAKLITYLKSADKPAAATGRFTDTAGSWAEAYIEFCARAGILSGDGSGAFRPDDLVTGRELAKMLLVVLGHPSEQYTGADWAGAVDRDAQASGIYDGFTGDRVAFISRDDACLLINNALQCPVITGYDRHGAAAYALDEMMTPKTLLEYRFGVKLVTGVVQANAEADLRIAGGALEEGFLHIAGYTRDFYISYEQTSHDMSLVGRRVTLYASFGSEYNIAYGMPSLRTSEVYVTFDSAAELRTLTDFGAMSLTEKTRYYRNFNPDDSSCLDIMTADDTVTIVDHEGDGQIDIVLVNGPAEVAPETPGEGEDAGTP